MPRSSGTYSPTAGIPVTSGAVASSSVINTVIDDLGDEITNSIPRDGTAPPTANIPFGNFRLTGLGDATAATDALNRQTADARYDARYLPAAFNSQAAPYVLLEGDLGKFVDVTGSGNVTLGALSSGFACIICAASGIVTLQATSGTLNWLNGNGIAVVTGVRTLQRNGVVTVYRDGTNWRVFGIGLS